MSSAIVPGTLWLVEHLSRTIKRDQSSTIFLWTGLSSPSLQALYNVKYIPSYDLIKFITIWRLTCWMRRNPSIKVKRAVLSFEFASYAAVFAMFVPLKRRLHTRVYIWKPSELHAKRTLESILAAGVGVDEFKRSLWKNLTRIFGLGFFFYCIIANQYCGVFLFVCFFSCSLCQRYQKYFLNINRFSFCFFFLVFFLVLVQ